MEPKPGYKTTEFWMSFFAMLFGALSSSGLVGPESALGQVVGFVLMALSALGYSVSRGMAKTNK